MLELDHLVINTRFDTDAAQATFERLGFTVSPRGYHTLGSINHAIVFDGHYLELIGLPADGRTIREEIAASPLGADGLVFRSDDPQRTFETLRAAGFEATPPQSFSRPVEPHGDARFVTVRLAPGQLPGGRVYFCQHLTPELVFRDEWRTHPNGAFALARLHLVDAPQDAYARLGALAPGFELTFWSRAAFDAHFGALAHALSTRSPRFAAVTIRTPQWHEIGRRAEAAGLPFEWLEARSIVLLPAFDTLLEFVP
ncbi:VOC family protein [Burkholderia sp. WAC0059]|uniref:VOC family protein n=1 Tax=Burkholderia sp. WAC0059 TaxID=2066022 RepID=UPI000C7EF672|nr:VOC family protein [Burkholderia sp. WAC0059]PLZ02903.1 VOC family protein [Burkholderia sp. WAC0059]